MPPLPLECLPMFSVEGMAVTARIDKYRSFTAHKCRSVCIVSTEHEGRDVDGSWLCSAYVNQRFITSWRFPRRGHVCPAPELDLVAGRRGEYLSRIKFRVVGAY